MHRLTFQTHGKCSRPLSAVEMGEKDSFVAPSYIGGKGLYVMGDCKAHAVIAEYTGRRLDMEQIEREEKEEEGKYSNEEYFIKSYSGLLVIDASVENAGVAKYANHMCMPNCEFVTIGLDRKDGGVTEVIFIKSLKPISMFEEISVKYEWQVNKNDVGIVCNCRSPNCIGIIGRVNKKELVMKSKKNKSKSPKK